MLDHNVQALRAKVRGFEAEGRTIRSRISKSSGKTRESFWHRKRRLGELTRWHLLAYAFMKGRPYKDVEPNVRQPIQSWQQANVLKVLMQHSLSSQLVLSDLLRDWFRAPKMSQEVT